MSPDQSNLVPTLTPPPSLLTQPYTTASMRSWHLQDNQEVKLRKILCK